ncbi:Ig-like domain-containing protein [Duganella callida]|uniref:DUF4214 domain-containing protein n=1 Tax=Duganella callida TaxID=2561932 RepID=A0A4Y9S0E3_9BURK|nr:Ig-like domain-containing protein [Duganella callida]TFW14850.1 DUF4214 domain-containing protein [Duganella callida]
MLLVVADQLVQHAHHVVAVADLAADGGRAAPAGGELVQVSFDDGASWQTASVSGTTWSLAHTLSGSGVLRVRVADAAGNHSAETVTPYVFDNTAPTVAISSDVAVANGVAPAVITFTFSEAPSGFNAAAISVSGGTLGALTATADPRVYTATFTPSAGVAAGSATISVSGAYQDAAGNGGSGGAIPSLQIDTVAPTAAAAGGVAFSNDTGASGDLVTNDPNQSLSGTLSAPLAAGEVVQVSLDGGTSWSVASVSGTSWTLAGRTLQTGTRLMMVRVADAAGNYSTPQTTQYTLDTTAPTVGISSNLGTVREGQSATITLTLSDPAALTLADIAVSGGVVSNFSGSGTSYTFTVTPPANSTTPVTVNVAGHVFSDSAGNSNTAGSLQLAVNTSPASGPGTPATVDGVVISTTTGTDPLTGLAIRTVTVPVVTSSRPEDTNTSHATLADIPLGLAAANGNPATSLVVSVPVGVGFAAAGPAVLLSGAVAVTDLIGRIDDHTVSGQATQLAMTSQAQQFLDSLAGGTLLQHATLTMSADATAASATAIINGADLTASGGTLQPFATGATATALVIDARALPQGIGLQLDNVEFAAIIGAANVSGGAGRNFIIGDNANQHIVLGTGADNDTVYGNDGDDVIATAAGNDALDGGNGADILAGGAGNDTLNGGAGNDVLQGGRSDTGQWQFYLKDGHVVGVHQMALAGGGASETVADVDLNNSVARLGFVGTDGARLQELSLLYHAAFHRAPDLAGLSFFAARGDLTIQQIATGFLLPEEATAAAGALMNLNNHDYVARLLQNTLGTAPTEAALAPFVARLDSAAAGDLGARAAVLADIALSAQHRALWVTDNGVALGGELLTQEQGWIAHSGDDRLVSGSGADLLVGGDGTDTVVYSGAAGAYTLSLSSAGDVRIGKPEGGLDVIRQIEKGEFNGTTLDLNFTQAATASLQELGMYYHLTLGRAGDYAGFLHWMDSGLQGAALASGFIQSAEFSQRYGNLDDNAFITLLYQNTVNRAPDAATLAQLDAYLGDHSRAELVAQLAQDVTLVGSQYGANGLGLIGGL